MQKELVQTVMLETGAAAAEKLGFSQLAKPDDLGMYAEDDHVMIVDSEGIRVGVLSERYGTMRSHRYEELYLGDELLVTRLFGLGSDAWHFEKTHAEKGAAIYIRTATEAGNE